MDKYLAGLGLSQGWLVIFDQRQGIGAIADRTRTEMMQTEKGREITVIRG